MESKVAFYDTRERLLTCLKCLTSTIEGAPGGMRFGFLKLDQHSLEYWKKDHESKCSYCGVELVAMGSE
jgi:hypothetical protein